MSGGGTVRGLGARLRGVREFDWWRRVGRYIATAVLLFQAALLVWTTLTPPGRTAVRAALFVPSLVPGAPVRPITWFTKSPHRSEVTFSDGIDSWTGDLYLPGRGGRHPGMVVALGVTPAGRSDPRVRHLGEGLARMGVATLIPVSDNLVNKRVTPRDVDFLVAAFEHLAGRPEVDPGRVGFLGVCVGSSLSLLAAEDPRIDHRVNFVSWFGGYYRLDELIPAVVTHSFERDGRVAPWTPDRLTEEVVRLRVIDLVEDPAERELLQKHVFESASLSAQQEAGLSPDARLVLRLLGAPTLSEAKALVRQLPPQDQALIDALSPASHAGRLRTRLYIMDDRSDTLIPFTETRAMVATLDWRYERYSEFSIFSHVNLDKLANPTKSIPQLWRLYRHVNAVFQSIR